MKIGHHLNIIVPLKSGVCLKGFMTMLFHVLLLHRVLICYLSIEIEFLPALSISLTIQYIIKSVRKKNWTVQRTILQIS